jgi:tellurite resistance protein TehA-like permease
MTDGAKQHSLEFVSGSWLLWVVATQSVASVFASAATSGEPGPASAFSAIGFMTWGIGVILHLVRIGFIMMRLFFTTLTPVQFTPPYWIAMGAAAISVLSGALLLTPTNRDFLLGEVRPFIAGLSLILWAWASWWIPALVLIWLWRHWSRGVRPTYEPSLWSLVFPLGMYGAASAELGRTIDQPWLIGEQALGATRRSAWHELRELYQG